MVWRGCVKLFTASYCHHWWQFWGRLHFQNGESVKSFDVTLHLGPWSFWSNLQQSDMGTCWYVFFFGLNGAQQNRHNLSRPRFLFGCIGSLVWIELVVCHFCLAHTSRRKHPGFLWNTCRYIYMWTCTYTAIQPYGWLYIIYLIDGIHDGFLFVDTLILDLWRSSHNYWQYTLITCCWYDQCLCGAALAHANTKTVLADAPMLFIINIWCV